MLYYIKKHNLMKYSFTCASNIFSSFNIHTYYYVTSSKTSVMLYTICASFKFKLFYNSSIGFGETLSIRV